MTTAQFRCPFCQHAFVRRMGKKQGSTRCPSCKQRFKRLGGQPFMRDRATVIREKSERQLRINQEIIASAPSVLRTAIRGSQVPLSAAEARFKARTAEKGWKPHRPSWPDFLVQLRGPKLIAVEVKGHGDRITKAQAATFDLLDECGLPVYVCFVRQKNLSDLKRWATISAKRKEKLKTD
jgi:uncharacterized Zn finger protein (UPF0148 family)